MKDVLNNMSLKYYYCCCWQTDHSNYILHVMIALFMKCLIIIIEKEVSAHTSIKQHLNYTKKGKLNNLKK